MHADKSDQSTNMEETDSPKFTVSQIMLLQRLRQTGLTKNQILKGLEEIEKLEDSSLSSPAIGGIPTFSNGNIGSSPDGRCSTGSTGNGTGLSSVGKDTDGHRNSPQSPLMKFNPSGVPHPLGQPNPLMFSAHLQNPSQLSLLPPVGSWPNTSQAVAVATAASLLQNGFGHGSVPPTVYPSLINGRALIRNGSGSTLGGCTVVDIDDEKVDITEELEELFRRDQAEVKEDIRKFISERHISQSAIAKATKNAISQSYISQWLAQPQDISGQKKKAIYTWFIVEKRKPVGLSNGLSLSQSLSSYRSGDMDAEGVNPMILKTKRGARFTWPKECLSILENYYNANSYPDECKREEIAHACNTIIQSQKPGMILSDLDKVTTVKVYNWFANRRKDDKRRRHIEHIEAMGHQQVILSPRRNSNVSPSPSCHSSDSHHDGDAPISERVPFVKKEDPMSLALEMAAVNHSILSLVNPHNDSASHDDDDDDEHDSAFDRAHETTSPYHQNRRERMTECRSYAG